MPDDINLSLMIPELVLFGLAFLVLGLDLLLDEKRKIFLAYTAAVGLIIAFAAAFVTIGRDGLIINESFVADGVTSLFRLALLGVAFLVVMASLSSLAKHKRQGEYYVLLLFSLSGALMLVGAAELITLFISVELMAMPAYALVAFRKEDKKSNEAALKYFILGLLASSVIVYAMSLIFGLSGETHLAKIGSALRSEGPALLLASLLFLAGFGVKIAAIPFHFWAPDAYEGSSPQIAAYLATITKIAAFIALIRIFFGALAVSMDQWAFWFGIIAAVTMVGGALMAIPQRNIKRLLAYSSISHVGFILMGMAVPTRLALSSMMFYLIVYAVSSAGAFFVVAAASRGHDAEDLDEYAGLGQRNPALALVMAIFILSLLGIPPLAGFWGKLYIIGAAVRGGAIWLAVIAVVASVISTGYYLRVIKEMYLVSAEKRKEFKSESNSLQTALYVTVALVILLLFNGPLFNLAEKASQAYAYLPF